MICYLSHDELVILKFLVNEMQQDIIDLGLHKDSDPFHSAFVRGSIKRTAFERIKKHLNTCNAFLTTPFDWDGFIEIVTNEEVFFFLYEDGVSYNFELAV